MNTKKIREYKKSLKPTNRQRDILVGLILGDGRLESQDKGRTYRLKVEHSISQKEYLLWLYDEFREWTRSEPYYKTKKNGQASVGFTTYSHSSFRFYAQQFYLDGKKIIPEIIHRLLTPIGIAVWYMDDGSLKSNKHKTYIIHSLGYKRNELERMRSVLQELFSIKTSLHKQKEKHWRIYIISESTRQFERLIYPYVKIIPSMGYKLLDNTMPKK